MILPGRHYTYPAQADEVERGALEVLVRPAGGEPFLATCALGFRDPAVPTAVWATPHPEWICTVSGGYAYLIDTAEPSQFIFLRYRPVMQVLPYLPQTTPSPLDARPSSSGLLLFAGQQSILAWGRDGEMWESERLSWEGITELRIEAEAGGDVLRGRGWDLQTDREIPFALNLETGVRI
jgi:hypothetical protein